MSKSPDLSPDLSPILPGEMEDDDIVVFHNDPEFVVVLDKKHNETMNFLLSEGENAFL